MGTVQALVVGLMGLIGLMLASPSALAQACHELGDVKAKMEKVPGGQWIELTDLQRAFLAGIYAMNPNTPSGLPFGDKAVLARVKGDDGGVVFFIDGEMACQPMP